MMGGYTEQSAFNNGLRSACAMLDKGIYSLISVIYQIFFNIANATLISGETIRLFYSRIQLIFGIIILFKLAISLIGGIVNPDTITDKKGGFTKIITRVLTALVMLALTVPLNIPGDITPGSYEAQLNNNGILFGTLFEFQSRILSNNSLAKLLLPGNSTGLVSNDKGNTDYDSVKKAGNNLAKIILTGFYTINLQKDDGDPTKVSDRMCGDADSTKYIDEVYNNSDSTVSDILDTVNADCNSPDGVHFMHIGKQYYVFSYSIIISTIAGAITLVILLGFVIDIAIRSFKLVILRLISPIPIVSYIDPKSEQSGAFGAWVKSVTSTYLDLFIRLAVLYFILFVINEFSVTGVAFDKSNGFVGTMSWVFLILGLLFFAKEAPKFIADSLGLKGGGAGFFSGIGKMMGAGALAAGTLSSAVTGARAGLNSFEKDGDASGLRKMGNTAKGVVRGIAGGTLGAVSGAVVSGAGLANSKDHHFSNTMKNVRARNNELLANSQAGGTLGGRMKNSLTSTLFGDTEFDKLKRDEELYSRQLESAKSKQAVAKSAMDYFKDQAAKGKAGAVGNIDYGNHRVSMNLKDWNAKVESTKASGSKYMFVKTDTGADVRMSLEDAIKYQSDMEESAAGNYAYAEYQKGDAMDAGVKQRFDNMKLAGVTVNTSTGKDLYSSTKGAFQTQFGAINTAQNNLDRTKDALPRAKANSHNAKK